MKKSIILLLLPLAIIITQCKQKETGGQKATTQFIQKATIDSVVDKLTKKYAEADKARLKKGLNQCAALWTEKDGTAKEFEDFCLKNFINDPVQLENIFKRISNNFESLFGHFNMISLDLKRAMHLDIGEMYDMDLMFGAYEPAPISTTISSAIKSPMSLHLTSLFIH